MYLFLFLEYVFVLQGGEPTETKKCPLWSDNKILHKTELAKVAEEVREKLLEDKVTLDIDPLKDLATVPAKLLKR